MTEPGETDRGPSLAARGPRRPCCRPRPPRCPWAPTSALDAAVPSRNGWAQPSSTPPPSHGRSAVYAVWRPWLPPGLACTAVNPPVTARPASSRQRHAAARRPVTSRSGGLSRRGPAARCFQAEITLPAPAANCLSNMRRGRCHRRASQRRTWSPRCRPHVRAIRRLRALHVLRAG